MVFLHSNGVGTARAVRIFKTYGADAIQVMSQNPYRLARDIRGIGFKTADAIAMKLGIEKTAMIRVRAGVSYALTEAMDKGHCGLPTEELAPLAEKLLEVPQELIRTAIELELQEGTVVADRVGETPCVFLTGLHRAERTIAERLTRLANGTLPWPWIDPDKAQLCGDFPPTTIGAFMGYPQLEHIESCTVGKSEKSILAGQSSWDRRHPCATLAQVAPRRVRQGAVPQAWPPLRDREAAQVRPLPRSVAAAEQRPHHVAEARPPRLADRRSRAPRVACRQGFD
jgi:hypothetical protein